jgi:hypothetical protein
MGYAGMPELRGERVTRECRISAACGTAENLANSGFIHTYVLGPDGSAASAAFAGP